MTAPVAARLFHLAAATLVAAAGVVGWAAVVWCLAMAEDVLVDLPDDPSLPSLVLGWSE